jgi:BirA family transcriptional regulator, biotin operon repressor / biotin---[acetyl-CoA-carboxylase] ligase
MMPEREPPAENLPFVRSIITRDVVTSTSDVARELAATAGVELPLLVWARRQSAGRGRGAHAWWSDEGSLTFTIAIDPRAHALKPEHEPRLALATAVAVIKALAPLVPADMLGIRWPNDVEAAGRKLGGILPERIDTPAGTRLLIGIGVNVRTRLADAPPDVARLATSLEVLRGAPMIEEDVASLLIAILIEFEPVMHALAHEDPALAQEWRRLDTLTGQPLRVRQGAQEMRGLGAGIDADGGLRLAGPSETLTLYGGQVLRDQDL